MWLRSLWLSLAVSLFCFMSWRTVSSILAVSVSFFLVDYILCGKRLKKRLILLIPGSGHQKASCSSTVLSSNQQIRAAFAARTQKVIGKSLSTLDHARGTRPSYFRPIWGPKGRKKFFETGSPLSQGLHDRPPPPPYLKVWLKLRRRY